MRVKSFSAALICAFPGLKSEISIPWTKTCPWGPRDLHPMDEDLSMGTPGSGALGGEARMDT